MGVELRRECEGSRLVQGVSIHRNEEPQTSPRKRKLNQFLTNNFAALQGEQPGFGFNAIGSRVTGQRSVRCHHAVAGDEQGHGIPAQRCAHGTAGSRFAQPAGNLAVGEHLTKSDLPGQIKHVPLKALDGCPIQGKVKHLPLTNEIFVDLAGSFK